MLVECDGVGGWVLYDDGGGGGGGIGEGLGGRFTGMLLGFLL